MIPRPPRQRVSTARMTAYSVVPILSIYAVWRIEKFWVLLGINLLAGVAMGILFQFEFEAQYKTAISILSSMAITACAVRHFAGRYNEGITAPG